jgi:hypothetical protein
MINQSQRPLGLLTGAVVNHHIYQPDTCSDPGWSFAPRRSKLIHVISPTSNVEVNVLHWIAKNSRCSGARQKAMSFNRADFGWGNRWERNPTLSQA